MSKHISFIDGVKFKIKMCLSLFTNACILTNMLGFHVL